MSFSKRYLRFMEWILPSPFALAFILTLLTAFLAYFLTDGPSGQSQVIAIWGYWEHGFWDLLTFSMQMILILVLGHTLALSGPASRFIGLTTRYCTSNTRAAVIVTVSAIITGYLNWGLGLVYGAVLARKVAENGQEKGIRINYPLIAASAYVSMMVWHGGFSGSAPLDVAGAHHRLVDQIGIISPEKTIGSTMNIAAAVLLLVFLPLLAYYLGKQKGFNVVRVRPEKMKIDKNREIIGTDFLDHSKWVGYLFAVIILGAVVLKIRSANSAWDYFSLNNVNLALFGLAVLAHGSFDRFISAVDQAVRGSSGIIIQFPLYAGIMGIMKYSGLLAMFAQFFIDVSNPDTFPVFAFISSGIVNILVPSGGGQWQVQGPILVDAAQQLGYPVSKTVMSLAYGDQLTNMLQPFWALPLLSITGLKARDILPYSILFMLVGGLIYLLALLRF